LSHEPVPVVGGPAHGRGGRAHRCDHSGLCLGEPDLLPALWDSCLPASLDRL